MDRRHTRTEIGALGEQLAADHLCALGLRIVARNWRCRYGELDLIAQDGDSTVVFVEVKTRTGDGFGGLAGVGGNVAGASGGSSFRHCPQLSGHVVARSLRQRHGQTPLTEGAVRRYLELVDLSALSDHERVACVIAERCLGVVTEAWDTGTEHGVPDARLHLGDGRVAAFEVTELVADNARQTEAKHRHLRSWRSKIGE